MAFLGIALGIAAGILLVPASVLFVQVVMAILPVKSRLPAPSRRPRLCVLIPAHNESSMIADMLRGVAPQLVAGDRLLVVADNCSDETARIASVAGAEVIERNDRALRGKCYALDFGVRHLERDPPEAVLIIDADCTIEDGAVERLARLCLQSARPVQASYLMQSPAGAGLKTRIAELAWLVRNHVRPLGFQRLGLPCQLMGSGMMFPWPLISRAALANGHLSEDYKLGSDLALAGGAPQFCAEARVTSQFPSSAEGIAIQRTRWEHGHLGMIAGVAPRLFLQALWRRDGKLLALALDLCVPPLALLLMLALVVFAAGAVFFLAAGTVLPLSLAATALVMLAVSVLLSWAGFGRHVIALTSLACAPFYALWKIPLYLKFLVARQVEWVRSKRDGE